MSYRATLNWHIKSHFPQLNVLLIIIRWRLYYAVDELPIVIVYLKMTNWLAIGIPGAYYTPLLVARKCLVPFQFQVSIKNWGTTHVWAKFIYALKCHILIVSYINAWKYWRISLPSRLIDELFLFSGSAASPAQDCSLIGSAILLLWCNRIVIAISNSLS